MNFSVGVGAAALWLLASSCGLWIYWITDWFREKRLPLPKWQPKSQALPSIPLALALIYLGLSLFMQFSHSDAPKEPQQPNLDHTILVDAVIFIVFFVASVIEPAESSDLADRGFRRENLLQQLNSGSLGFIASLAPTALFLLLTIPWRSEETVHPLLQFIKEHGSFGVVARATVIACVLAPLTEELIFRVTLQGWLSRFAPPQVAIPVVAVVFAGVHGFPDAVALIPLALLLGYIYHRTRSYVAVVTVHALFNGLNVLMMLAGLQLEDSLTPPQQQDPPPQVSEDHDSQNPAPVPLPQRLPESRPAAGDEPY
ncbi:MAG: CPBP family intramembrane metalloprotease [Planctomycetaceae bacterium]|nr:CPBP family intramembrane metalloprotease [Planctomycetaceae bacterium]